MVTTSPPTVINIGGHYTTDLSRGVTPSRPSLESQELRFLYGFEYMCVTAQMAFPRIC